MEGNVSEQARLVAAAALAARGPVQDWTVPPGYPQSLALCVIDAISSVGVRYGSVVKVVQRYQVLRGAAADTDGARALLGVYADLGVDGFITRVGTRHRTSTRPGAPRKAQVIAEAAEVLVAHRVDTVAQFQAAAAGPDGEALKGAWLALPGQRSGITWRYALMLAQVPGVKPDRMVRRFVRAASGPHGPDGRAWTTASLASVVEDAAGLLGVSPTVLDHQVWRAQSGRR